MAKLICPDCGAKMVLRWSGKFNRNFYGCTNFPKCRGTHGAHPDGSPLGVPGDTATKQGRIECHTLFDEVWKSENPQLKRKNAYRLLAKLMGLRTEDAHISSFSLDDCRRFKERWAEWQKKDNPDMQFFHLFTNDLKRMLADGSCPFSTDEVKAEITRREEHHKQLTQGRR